MNLKGYKFEGLQIKKQNWLFIRPLKNFHLCYQSKLVFSLQLFGKVMVRSKFQEKQFLFKSHRGDK